MTNKEQIKKDISTAFDFAEKVISEPEMLEKIASGSTICFLDTGDEKREMKPEKKKKKYVRFRSQFELL